MVTQTPGIFFPHYPQDEQDKSQEARMVQSIQIGKCDMAHQQNRGPNVSRRRISQSFQIEAEKTFDKQTSLQNEVLTNQVQKDHTSA